MALTPTRLTRYATPVYLIDAAGNDVILSAVRLTPHHVVSASGTNATLVSATARLLGMVACYNVNDAPRYLKLYDLAGVPNVGTDTPVLTLLIPGNSAHGAGSNLPIPNPITLSNGLAYALTTGMADNDSVGVGAAEVCVNLGWST